MMTIKSELDLNSWTDRDLTDIRGVKVGKVEGLYYDEITGEPQWLLVKTGLFGTKKTFVPASEVYMSGDHLATSFTKDRVEDAPNIDDDEILLSTEEERLFSHYGMTRRPLGTRWRSG
jgi:hypothetical protein